MVKANLRNTGAAFKLLEYLFYEKCARISDLRQICRNQDAWHISKALKKLETYELIECDDDIVRITQKGEVFILDRPDSGYCETYSKEIKDKYATWRNKGLPNYLDLQRAKCNFTFMGVAVRESQKPGFGQFCDWMAGKLDATQLQEERLKFPPYREISSFSQDELVEMMRKGIFYDKLEVMEWMDSHLSEGSDLYHSARLKGVFINSTRAMIVYVQPHGSDRMIKLNYSDIVANRYIAAYLKDTIGDIYRNGFNLDCLMFSDGDGLVYQMATGWKRGVLTDGHKKLLKDTKKNYESDFVLDTTQLRNISSLKNSAPSFCCYSSSFDHVYVVPAEPKGLMMMQEFLYKTDEEIFAEGYRLVTGQEPEHLDYTPEQAGEIARRRHFFFTHEGKHYAYLPYYDIMNLHGLSMDDSFGVTNISPGWDAELNVITLESLCNAISHSIRRNVRFWDANGSVAEIFDVRLYGHDGYVCRGTDPYASRRKSQTEPKKTKKYNYSRITLRVEDWEFVEWKRMAEQKNMTLNSFIRTCVMNEMGEFEREKQK